MKYRITRITLFFKDGTHRTEKTDQIVNNVNSFRTEMKAISQDVNDISFQYDQVPEESKFSLNITP